MGYVIAPSPQASVEVRGTLDRYPVHRIYCVGRNYADHAREMGGDPEREPPFFFMKPADAVVPSGATISYPTRTANFHHELELVIAIGKGGSNIPVDRALEHVYGYAVGNDFTRRDLQTAMRNVGRPWDVSKGFDRAAAIGSIRPVADGGHALAGRMVLKVNGETRQDSDVSQMIWSVPEIVAELSTFFELVAGDLIYSGTPAGVGALKAGDRIDASIEGLDPLVTLIA
ncbi:MAG: fumarylacetoacetate hydrolase family protein [Steroidobacteraceae bacterium]